MFKLKQIIKSNKLQELPAEGNPVLTKQMVLSPICGSKDNNV